MDMDAKEWDQQPFADEIDESEDDTQLSQFSALLRNSVGVCFHVMSLIFLAMFALTPFCWLFAGGTIDRLFWLVDAEMRLPQETQTIGTLFTTFASFILAVFYLSQGSIDDGHPKSPLHKRLQKISRIAVWVTFVYVLLLFIVVYPFIKNP